MKVNFLAGLQSLGGDKPLSIAPHEREKKDKEKNKPREEAEPEEKPAKGTEKEKKKGIATLKAELEALRREIRKEGSGSSEEKPKSKVARRSGEKAGMSLFGGGLDQKEKEGTVKANGDTSSSSEASSSSSTTEAKDKKKGEKKDEKRNTRKKEARKKKKLLDRKKKKKKRKKSTKDRGPFGLEPTEGGDSEGSGSDGSEESSESFHKAPAGMTLFLRLQRYAQRHPGKLAARLLRKMKAAGRYPVGALMQKVSDGSLVEPAALAYYQAVMVPNMKDSWTPRTQREMKYMAIILDLLAESKASQAADICAQRLKALEKSVMDRNQ